MAAASQLRSYSSLNTGHCSSDRKRFAVFSREHDWVLVTKGIWDMKEESELTPRFWACEAVEPFIP